MDVGVTRMEGYWAISLQQPWASLVAGGLKTNETRSWRRPFKGQLFIHASKGFPKEYQDLCIQSPFREALKQIGLMPPDLRSMDKILPLGSIIAVVNLVGCYPTGKYIPGAPPAPARDSWEYAFGDYTPGRWFWKFEDVRPVTPAIPCKGALGVFAVPERVAGVLRDMGYEEGGK